MESEVSESRPESPKKKLKSLPPFDNEVDLRDQSCQNEVDSGKQNSVPSTPEVNGLAPARKGRVTSSAEIESGRTQSTSSENEDLRIQDEVVSSSDITENAGKKEEKHQCGNADSVSNDLEEVSSPADSHGVDRTTKEV